MDTITFTYNQIFQIAGYFKSLEEAPDLTFSQRRRLVHLNEQLMKEHTFLSQELRKIADEYCEKDEEGNFVISEDGSGQKIREGQIENCNTALTQIYSETIDLTVMPFKLPEEYFEQLRCDTSTLKLIEEHFLQ